MAISPALLLLIVSCSFAVNVSGYNFSLAEATVAELQQALKQNTLTSRQLVEYYLSQILEINPRIRGIIEVNPDVLTLADKADMERLSGPTNASSGLHGIPILLKDNIATMDKLNTTAGSFALLGSVVPRDAGVVTKLRAAGAIIMGKAALSELAHYRSFTAPSGWSGRGGQALNPYVMSEDPCGSGTGSATSVASNMVAVTLGTETDGSIICPSSVNSVVGIKPTLGLTSRAGVVPISLRQDTVGPICHTVLDAAYVLDAIVGYDPNDNATIAASKFIPPGGYIQFLNANELQGKRLGIVRDQFFVFPNGSYKAQAFENHFQTLSKNGAILVDNLALANINMIYSNESETIALLTASPIRTLAGGISFNLNYSTLVAVVANMQNLIENGIVKLMTQNNLDALITPDATVTVVLAIGGFQGISVPAGYEPRLIEIAYAFEQATKIRKPPTFLVSSNLFSLRFSLICILELII
ncbi:hypothetical protein NE237_033244 [Protea cynaroides]|uniref:Amidase domain-containing protein n=1 Tax=Protea cynaroides TaxID=273540 RepID=A0A9Q0R4F8_9MAGN|nr:hypothetical protein NE237_033244 [Protea cynaroides]